MRTPSTAYDDRGHTGGCARPSSRNLLRAFGYVERAHCKALRCHWQPLKTKLSWAMVGAARQVGWVRDHAEGPLGGIHSAASASDCGFRPASDVAQSIVGLVQTGWLCDSNTGPSLGRGVGEHRAGRLGIAHRGRGKSGRQARLSKSSQGASQTVDHFVVRASRCEASKGADRSSSSARRSRDSARLRSTTGSGIWPKGILAPGAALRSEKSRASHASGHQHAGRIAVGRADHRKCNSLTLLISPTLGHASFRAIDRVTSAGSPRPVACERSGTAVQACRRYRVRSRRLGFFSVTTRSNCCRGCHCRYGLRRVPPRRNRGLSLRVRARGALAIYDAWECAHRARCHTRLASDRTALFAPARRLFASPSHYLKPIAS